MADKKKKEKEPEVKRLKLYDLQLTKFEILHIRDLMSVLLPPKGETTLSKSLASVEDREITEEALWEKIINLCTEAGLPVGQEAPDYIIIPTSHPTMGVFQLNREPEGEEEAGFLPEGEEG